MTVNGQTTLQDTLESYIQGCIFKMALRYGRQRLQRNGTVQLATHSHHIRERAEWELIQGEQQKFLFSWIFLLTWLIV